jgi:hypothetical protein
MKIVCGNQIKKDEMDRAYGTHGAEEKWIRVLE